MAATALGGKLYWGTSANPSSNYVDVISCTVPNVTYPKVPSKRQARTYEEFRPGVPDYGEASCTYEADEAKCELLDALRGGAAQYWRYVLPSFGELEWQGWLMSNDATISDVNQLIEYNLKIVATSLATTDGT